jgi:hypothetical protein
MNAPHAPRGDAATPSEPVDVEAALREQARLMALKIVVIVLGVILVAMAIVVFSTLIIRIVKGGGAANPSPSTAAAPSTPPASAISGVMPDAVPPGVAIPAGARVVSSALGEGRFALTLEQDGRFTVILFDAATLKEVGRTTLAPAAPVRP